MTASVFMYRMSGELIEVPNRDSKSTPSRFQRSSGLLSPRNLRTVRGCLWVRVILLLVNCFVEKIICVKRATLVGTWSTWAASGVDVRGIPVVGLRQVYVKVMWTYFDIDGFMGICGANYFHSSVQVTRNTWLHWSGSVHDKVCRVMCPDYTDIGTRCSDMKCRCSRCNFPLRFRCQTLMSVYIILEQTTSAAAHGLEWDLVYIFAANSGWRCRRCTFVHLLIVVHI